MSWILVGSAGVGAANTLFGGEKDTKVKPLPQSEASKTGQAYLEQLLGRTPDVPQQGVANLTPMQQAIQGMLSGTLGKVTEGGTAAQDYYKNILGKDFNLEDDPRYQTLMQQSGVLTKQASTQARRGSERMGMLDSSPANEFEGSEIQKAQSPIMQAIGNLLTQKENERASAAEGVGRAGAQEIGNIAAVGNIADQQRIVEQMQADAIYNQVLQQMMFPYQYQSNIANSLLNYSPGYTVEGGGPNDFSKFLSGAGAGASIFSGMGGLGGGSGGAGGQGSSVQVSGSSFNNPQAVYGAPQGY